MWFPYFFRCSLCISRCACANLLVGIFILRYRGGSLVGWRNWIWISTLYDIFLDGYEKDYHILI